MSNTFFSGFCQTHSTESRKNVISSGRKICLYSNTLTFCRTRSTDSNTSARFVISAFYTTMETIVPRTEESVVRASNPFMDLARTVVIEERCLSALSVQLFVTRTQFDIDLLFVDEQWSMTNTQRSDELKIL